MASNPRISERISRTFYPVEVPSPPSQKKKFYMWINQAFLRNFEPLSSRSLYIPVARTLKKIWNAKENEDCSPLKDVR